MNHNLIFGGGASGTTMSSLVIVAVLAGALAVLFAKRRFALTVFLSLVFLIPFTEQLYVGGLHLYTARILVIAGIFRLVKTKVLSSERLFATDLTTIDALFSLWALSRGIALILDYRSTGVVIGEIAFWMDAIGGYLLLRHLIQNRDDMIWSVKVLATLLSFLAVCLAFESLSGINPFSYIDTSPIIPWLRNGRPRAQGPFANSITAGVFGAVLVPLFYWLWKFGNSKILGGIAIAAAALNIITALASTGALAFTGAMLALAMWPARFYLQKIRWGIGLAVIVLAFAMKAPVWYLIARMNVVGGSNGWDRAYLINATIQHFSSWWLIGTQTRASWGYDTWDACNQFVLEATDGGLLTLVLFVVLLTYCFSLIGRARKRAVGDRTLNWFYWCMGAALFANLMAFVGVDYFDQTFTEWLVFLAMIAAVTGPQQSQSVRKSARDSMLTPRLAPDSGFAPTWQARARRFHSVE